MKLRNIFYNIRVSFTDAFQQMKDGEIRFVAAALAFSTLLSLVPFLAVMLSIFKSIGGLEFLYPKVEAFLLSYVEQGVGAQAIQVIQKILQRLSSAVIGTTGGIALVLSSFKLLHDMERGINRVWNVKETRPFYRQIFVSLVLMIVIPFGLAVYGSFRSLAILKSFFRSSYQPLSDFLMLFAALFLIYKFVPYLKVRNRPALLAAFVAGSLLVGLKNSFTWLAAQAFMYSKMYGSLAAIPLFCLWILGIWYIILAGVALTASSQKRRWLEENYGFHIRHPW